jgi:NitT/TauT family transport system permease protein
MTDLREPSQHQLERGGIEQEIQKRALRSSALSGWWRVAIPLASVVVFVTAWHLFATYDDLPSVILPSPAQVWDALVEFRTILLSATWQTLSAVLLGFGLSVVFGVVLAMGLAYSRKINAGLYPSLVAFHAVPKAALAPLLLIWFGFGMEAKVAVAFLTALFPITVATTSGLRSVSPELHDLAKSLHASRMRTFLKIDLPHALPFVFAGLRVGMSLALVGVIVGEFVVSDSGLAVLLQRASVQFQAPLAFAAMVVLSVLSVLLFGAVVFLERLVMPWTRDS